MSASSSSKQWGNLLKLLMGAISEISGLLGLAHKRLVVRDF